MNKTTGIDFLAEVVTNYNKGTCYLDKNNFKKAQAYIKKALDQYEFKEGLVNIGNTYRAMGDDKNMMRCYLRALEPSVPYLETPKDVKQDTIQHALNNLGLAYYTFGDDEKAIKTYTAAIKKDPTFWEAWWNCSTATLRQASSGAIEKFPSGWEMYNARFLKSKPIKMKNKRDDLAYWKPGTKVKSIIVLVEQGIGDNIMFGRYIPRLREFADEIYVQCDASLECIFSDFKCVRDAIEIEDIECAYPICSLGSCFDDIPAGDWLRGKFGSRSFADGFNVGIVWSGSPTHANNAYRSTTVGRFSRLAKYCNLYSLDPTFKGSKYVTACGNKTWVDTAECINGLDLVIGVDTSVMHMCGSLGHEGWLLQPYKETDFRWGNGVRRSVWYDDIVVYENPQDWDYVFDCVERDLRERVYL